MKISVLIAAHQSGPQLADSLASVRAQLGASWELLVVEYGSADETRAIVSEFGVVTRQPVTYLNLGENHGAASARNRLLELATTDLAAFLDPANQWTPPHLANAVAQLDGAADIVASDVRVIDPASGRMLREIVVPAQLSLNPTRALFVRDALAVPSSVVFRRELVKRIGFFDLRFRVAETRDFWLRCALSGARFAATHSATCRGLKQTRPTSANALLAAEQAVQFYEKHRDVANLPAALRRRFLSASLVALGRLLQLSDPMRAKRCFWRAWSLQPLDIQTLGKFALTGWRTTSDAKAASSSDKLTPPDLTAST